MSGKVSVFRNSYQHGLLSILYSAGAKPLEMWDINIKNGYVQRFLDPDLKALVLEIGGSNVSTTYIMCPKGKMVLGISMPFLVMIVKNLNKYFTFEVTILDADRIKRRFRIANFQSTTQIMPMSTVMPIGLADGWNQIQFNLSDFCQRAYHTQFSEVLKIKINANIRLRRVYFAEKLHTEDELPNEYKLYFPFSARPKMKKPIEPREKENIEPEPKKSSLQEIPRLSRDSEEKQRKQSDSRRRSSVVVQEIKRSSGEKSVESVNMGIPQTTDDQVETIEADEAHKGEVREKEEVASVKVGSEKSATTIKTIGGEDTEKEAGESTKVGSEKSATIVKVEKESVHSIKAAPSQKISLEMVRRASKQHQKSVDNIDTVTVEPQVTTEQVILDGQSAPEIGTEALQSSSLTERVSVVRSLEQIKEEVNEPQDLPEIELT